jgi:2'-5' RNA ligase
VESEIDVNKYYIGYPLPKRATQALEELRPNIMEGVMGKPEDLHITALYLGEQTSEVALRVFGHLSDDMPPAPTGFKGFARFGGGSCLVITLIDPTRMLQHVHRDLKRALVPGRTVVEGPHDYEYTPHITLLKSKKAFCRATVPAVAFDLNLICLFEKESGGEYGPIAKKEMKV